MEGSCRLRLLGPVQVERDGKPMRGFESRKALALLGYLAVHDGPIPREQLVDLLWPELSEGRGRANLSWVLNRISSLLPGCLEADRHTVGFGHGSPYWLDTDAFEGLETQGEPASLAAAVELYRGEFLEGLYLHGCPEFEIWLVGERERWTQRVARVLEKLVRHHGQPGQVEQGLGYARRLLVLEPWREETHRQVMRLLAWSEQRGAALAQYETCCRILAEELGVEPAAETTRLYQQIRDGELEIPPAPADRFPDLPAQPPSFLLDEEEPAERPVFVARESELARLDGFLEHALAGRGRVVFVTGGAGRGKTALVQEFARRAQAAHPDLVVASGYGRAYTGVGDPYLPFREVLSLLTGDVEARYAAGTISRDYASRLWNLIPLSIQAMLEGGPDLIETFLSGPALIQRAAAFTPVGGDWQARLTEWVEDKLATPPDPNLQQSALFEQYTQVLTRLAVQRPLLLVLDDLQWADGGSTGLLFHLGRRIEGGRVLIVGAYRPEEVALGRPPAGLRTDSGQRERHPLEPVVNEFKRHYGDIEVDLAQAEDWGFVEALLDTEPNRFGDAFRQTLYRQTKGHPLFTVELLRGMQERGDLIQDEEGCWQEGLSLHWKTLPARVEAVIAERIGRLAEPVQEALRVASVEGEAFTAEVLARVLGSGKREVVRWLSKLDTEHRLVSAQGVKQVNGQRLSLYRFRHILFQMYLYNNLGEGEQAYLHEDVGTALEALYGERAGEIAAQLAWHFQEAAITEKAVDYLGQAGQQARRQYANEEAMDYFRRALALLEDAPPRASRQRAATELHESLGDVLELTGQYDEARTAYQDALASLPAHDRIRQGRMHYKMGETWRYPRQFEKAMQAYNRAETALGRELAEASSEWWQQWVEIQLARINVHYFQGETRELTEVVEKIRPVVEQHGTPPQRVDFFLTLILADNRRDRFIVSEQTLAHSATYLEAAQESGSLLSIAHARLVLGFNLLWRGEYDAAKEQINTALELTVRMGHLYLQTQCLTYLTIVYRKLGQVDEAMDYALQSLEAAMLAQNPAYIGAARANLAWVAWKKADMTEALEMGQAALESWQLSETGFMFQWLSLFPLIRMTLDQGRIAEVVEYTRALLEPAQQALPDTLQMVFEGAIEAWERGEPEVARTYLDRAIGLAQEMGYL